ncbi:hypothetical protein Tco_0335562 [Tanacetum coccineum]
MEKRIRWQGYSFERKPCFVCGSLSHLIKDCDYYEKKMAREAAFKSTRVIHANVRQVTPAWTNSNRVNKANQFTPRPVQLNNIRPNFSTASRQIKQEGKFKYSGKQNVSSGSLHVSSGTHIKSGTSSFNTGKQHVNSGSMYVNSGTKNKSGGSRVNTGKQNVNSGRVHVNTARVTSPVLSNQTSQHLTKRCSCQKNHHKLSPQSTLSKTLRLRRLSSKGYYELGQRGDGTLSSVNIDMIVCKVIQNGNSKEARSQRTLNCNGAVPKESSQAVFHGMEMPKEILAAIKTRFGDEDANHKFLRSLPPAWDSLAMTMRTKKNIDTLSIDDLYNNLSVFEQDIQKTSSSSLASDNVAFLSQAKASSSKHKPSHSSGSYSSIPTPIPKQHNATPSLADKQKAKSRCKKMHGRHLIREKLNVSIDTILGHFARKCSIKVSKEGSSRKQALRIWASNQMLRTLGYEEEMSREYKGVPHPLSGDYTPREQEDIDDSLYEYGKHGPQPKSPSPTVSNASSIVFSFCPSNDSDGELGAVSDASTNSQYNHSIQ